MLSFLAIVVKVGIVGEVSRRWVGRGTLNKKLLWSKTSGTLLSASSVAQAICPPDVPTLRYNFKRYIVISNMVID